MRRTIVVGGSGYIGRNVVFALREHGHEVTVFCRGEAPGLPDGVRVVRGDHLTADWPAVLPGHDSVVFSTGATTETPRRPASAFFRRHNVDSLRRLLDAAAATGVSGAVVHSSYYATLERERHDLASRHPYVASRIEQAEVARAAEIPVAVLEIPFVFGHTPHRGHLLSGMLPWLRGETRVPLLAPDGGTALVSARSVGVGTVNALGRSGNLPVAQANWTWRELVSRLAAGAGHPRPDVVRRLPGGALTALAWTAGAMTWASGREPGLSYRHFSSLFRSGLYVDVCRPELGITADDLGEAVDEFRLG